MRHVMPRSIATGTVLVEWQNLGSASVILVGKGSIATPASLATTDKTAFRAILSSIVSTEVPASLRQEGVLVLHHMRVLTAQSAQKVCWNHIVLPVILQLATTHKVPKSLPV